MELDKAYNPKKHEDKIYQSWEKKGLFSPEKLKGDPFSVMMPPPNVTGVLHLGHALENALMDTMVRYQRLKGKKVVLIPGTDHAAVATQAKVEKLLTEKGHKNPREELGREKLLKEIRDYAEQSKTTILKQIRKMGTSCDWDRLAYTFDETRSAAVNRIFKMMYDDGLIYRGYRVVNWSVKGQSTCSDDELVHVERKAKLYTFKYAKDFPVTIASTRPETKLGDTAVAVNPKDSRYKKYIGQRFKVNFCGKQLKIKIIANPEVDPEFGTGALGVTPAHSAIDFEMYVQQKAKNDPIDLIPVIDEKGKMTAQASGEFVGLDVEKAREKVIEKLKKDKLFIKEEEITQSVGTSDRFGDVVEALPLTQWFVDVNYPFEPGKKSKNQKSKKTTLKKLMKEAVATGLNGDKKQKVNITPKRFEKLYFQWIDNLRDWCISRQIWWGHRIPVWYKKDFDFKILVSRHGQALSNKEKFLNSDINNQKNGLTAAGKKDISADAKRLAEQGAKIDLIFTSDFKRTKETAEIFAKAFNAKVVEDKRLREVGMGKFEGGLDSSKGPFFKLRENFKAWHHDSPQGIESFDSLKSRVFAVLDEIKEKHQDKKVMIVTHGDPLRIISGYGQDLTDEEIFNLTFPGPGEQKWFHFKKEETKVAEKSPGKDWVQDEDTLDTWFSSGLWTFSTLGWPQNQKIKKSKNQESKKNDLEMYHPSGWMQMGYEILFFWMARMILMTTYALDEIPFHECYIHGMLRDEKGQKFSKSLGNNIDPLEMIDQYGTDALRWGLLIGNTPGNDSRFYEEKVESARNLVNKLWNISRFILDYVDEVKDIKNVKDWTLADEWILFKFNGMKRIITEAMDKYDFSLAGELIRDFTWNDLADWYLEIAKMPEEKKLEKKSALQFILVDLLKLWHPFVPFVTTAIWNGLNFKEELMVSAWPTWGGSLIRGPQIGKKFENVQDLVKQIRNVRKEYNVEPKKKIKIFVKTKEKYIIDNFHLFKLAGVEDVEILDKKPKGATVIIGDDVEIYLPLADLLDFDKEKERLEKEKENLEKYLNGLEKKLGNKQFVKNAPEAVVKVEQEKQAEAQEKLKKIEAQLKNLK